MNALLFLCWCILHLFSWVLLFVWVIPSMVLMLYAMYRGCSALDAPDEFMPWGAAVWYAGWVNRVTKAGKGDNTL